MTGTVLLIILAVLLAIFVLFGFLALIKKPGSVFADMPDERNPMEGKKVVFVPNENEPENADGAKGHLEATGDSNYKQTFYGRFIKRFLDVFISFFGLLILSPVYLVIIIAILIDDPGPIFFTQKRIGRNKRYFKLHKFRSMKMSTLARCIIGTTPKIAKISSFSVVECYYTIVLLKCQ